MDEREKYFEFVTGVLGIKSILLIPSIAASEALPLLLLVEGLSGYSAAENELLSKMIAALKMDVNMYRLADLQQAGEISRQYTVEFCDQLPGEARENVQATYSPRTLLKNPSFKKQAWEDLQKVIRHFSA